MQNKKLFKRADALLIIILLVISLIMFIPKFINNNKSKIAVVYKNGEIVNRIELDSVKNSYDIDLKSSPKVILQVDKGKIRYKSSECHDKLCVKCGWLTKVGDTSVCIPSKTMVIIEGESDNESPDAISY